MFVGWYSIHCINELIFVTLQLFKKAHPQKKLALRLGDAVPMGPLPANANDKLFFHNVDNLRPTKQAIKGIIILWLCKKIWKEF